MKPAQLRARLKDLGFLKAGAKEKTLLALCHAGRLHGGLSVSLAATPDEVLGGLCTAMGGAATALRLEDVRGRGPFELHVRTREGLERWQVEDTAGLIHNLNDFFRSDTNVRACAVLGEWEDMLQLLVVDRFRLLMLHSEPWFEAQNRADLIAMGA
jgi:hypothetical protein